jgi:aminopeptidase-like protein
MNPELKKHVKEELSGENAKNYVEQISHFHRIQASTHFHEAAEHVKQQLLEIGIQDARIEQFTSDGAKKYWTHTSPVGWEVKSAELRIAEPEQQLVTRYADIPTSLHAFSNATPPQGTTAELIDVGKGTKAEHYEGIDVKNKLVLATGRASIVHEQAVFKRGAAGVITDTLAQEFRNVRESIDIPDAHGYQGIWPTAENLRQVQFGFSLSKRQGNHLRNLLRDKKTVKLHAKVNARLFPGNLDVVTATIQGSEKPDEEIFIVAHLCHPQPSANDNASGSGLLIEIARTLQTLITTGRIPRPKRTIRFMWVPEFSGTIAYLHDHPDAANHLIAGINLDMVGQNQELCKSTLNIDRTPDSHPSYLNDLILNLTEDTIKEFDHETTFGTASTFRYAESMHSGGSDHHVFVDSTIGVPCIMLLQWPDMFYHTSMDTIDKVSPESLKRVGWITTTAALILANADTDTAIYLLNQTCSRGQTRIQTAQHQAIQELYEKTHNTKTKTNPQEHAKALTKTAYHHKNKIEHITQREKQALHTVKKLAINPDLDALIEKFTKHIDETSNHAIQRIHETVLLISKSLGITLPTQLEETEAEKQARNITPTRQLKCTLDMDTFKQLIGEEQYKWYEETGEKDTKFALKRFEILNFMNGKRTLYDIVKAVSAEYGETNMEHALRFIKDLEKTGFATLQTT